MIIMDAIEKISEQEKDEQLFNAYSVMFYFAGSIVTIEPDEDGLPGFCSSGLLRNLPVNSRNPAFATASGFFKAPCTDAGSCCENVVVHYQKLFGDKVNSVAWPAESSWPSSLDSILHKVHGSVGEFYSKYSFHPDNDKNLPEDHLGIELLFLNKLITLYIKESNPLSKDVIKRDIIGFVNSHLLNWLPDWVIAVTEKSGTKCFKGVAHLILASVEDVRSLLVR